MRSPLIHFSEPEARALLTARAHARELEFLAGQIGEATFLRSLLIYGVPLEDAKRTLNDLKETQHVQR